MAQRQVIYVDQSGMVLLVNETGTRQEPMLTGLVSETSSGTAPAPPPAVTAVPFVCIMA